MLGWPIITIRSLINVAKANLFFLCLMGTMHSTTPKIIIWDNDGTIMGSRNPHDPSNKAKVILPNVEQTMKQDGVINIICSGTKNPESESEDYDPEMVIAKFKALMRILPVSMAVFSPARGGTQCWVLTKEDDSNFSILKAHDDDRYRHLIGTFKKPDTGMLAVIKDLLLHNKGLRCEDINTLFIGDTDQDMQAAHDYMLPFLHAYHVHEGKKCCLSEQHVLHWQHGTKRN
jgi:hypothetical protein